MLTRWRRNPTGLRRAPPSPPAGVGGDHSNLGPADRWRTGDPVPGGGSLPGPLQSCCPAQALSGEATRNVAGKSMTRVPSSRASLFSKRFSQQHNSDRRPGGTVCPARCSHSARPHPLRGAVGPPFTDREAEAPKKMRDSPKITQEADLRARLPIRGCRTPCPCPPPLHQHRWQPFQAAGCPTGEGGL